MTIRLNDDLFYAWTEEERNTADLPASTQEFFSRVKGIIEEATGEEAEVVSCWRDDFSAIDFNEEIVEKIQDLYNSNLWVVEKRSET